jgi:hypothetical protein
MGLIFGNHLYHFRGIFPVTIVELKSREYITQCGWRWIWQGYIQCHYVFALIDQLSDQVRTHKPNATENKNTHGFLWEKMLFFPILKAFSYAEIVAGLKSERNMSAAHLSPF